jgi:hypothetical protein
MRASNSAPPPTAFGPTVLDLVQNIIGEAVQIDRFIFQLSLLARVALNGELCRGCPTVPLVVAKGWVEKLDDESFCDAAQDLFEIANALTENIDAIVKPLEDAILNRIGDVQVDNRNAIGLLAEAIETANSLFHAHRVPRKIVVDHEAAELKIDTFASNL